MNVIATIPPYAEFMEEVCSKPLVSAVRLNTVLPAAEPYEQLLERISKNTAGKPLWIDLKCRQLRVTNSAYVPFHHVELSHNIEVNTPITILFDNGKHMARVSKVFDGNKMVIESFDKFPLESGMSVSILDPSLKIDGYFTEKDMAYIEAAKKVGLHNYMLSYVEQKEDIEDLLKMDPEARIIAKIESKKGLEFIESDFLEYESRVQLMAARGDLFLELERPTDILYALRKIIEIDPDAIAASRMLSSVEDDPEGMLRCSEICDIGYLLNLGYKNFMLGDELGFRKDILNGSLGVLAAIEDSRGR